MIWWYREQRGIIKLKNEIKEIIKNGGATLDTNLKNADLKNGYMVSMVGYENIISLDNLSSMEEIEETLNEYKRIAKRNNAFIGAWVDDNKIYLDISKNYKRLVNAIKIGKKNKQLAIFDINNSLVINI